MVVSYFASKFFEKLRQPKNGLETVLFTVIYLWKFNFEMSTFEKVPLKFLCPKSIY